MTAKGIITGLTVATAGLCALLVVLKLAGIIATSWVWVLAPVWLPFVLAFVSVLAAVAVVNNASKQEARDAWNDL